MQCKVKIYSNKGKLVEYSSTVSFSRFSDALRYAVSRLDDYSTDAVFCFGPNEKPWKAVNYHKHVQPVVSAGKSISDIKMMAMPTEDAISLLRNAKEALSSIFCDPDRQRQDDMHLYTVRCPHDYAVLDTKCPICKDAFSHGGAVKAVNSPRIFTKFDVDAMLVYGGDIPEIYAGKGLSDDDGGGFLTGSGHHDITKMAEQALNEIKLGGDRDAG